MRALLRRPGFRVAGRTLLIAVMIVTVFVGAAAVAAAEPTPTPPATTPPAPAFNFDNGLLHPTVTPVNPQPPNPLADITRAPVQFPVTAAPAPLSLGTVPVATTLPAAPSIPPATSLLTTGSDGCIQLPASAIALVPKCDSPGGQAVTAVVKVVSFAEDPLGWLTDKMGQGASGIMSWVADTANNATAADLTSTWWIDAYKKAFAVAIILFGMLTLWNMSQLGRGKIGPEEFADTITTRSWGFFGGVIFGPPLAKFFIEGAGILSRGVISAMPGYNGGKMDATTVNKSIQGASEGKIVGGAFIAFLLLLVVCICALFLFVSLAVQTFAVYASGAVFPIAFTWVINIRHRGGSMKIPFMILAIIFSRPLLFFIVGLVMAMARAAVVQSSDDASTNLAMVIMVGVGLAIAAFSPLLLLKFAPVIPTGMNGGTGHGAAVSNPGVAQPGVKSKLQGLRNGKSSASGGAGSSSAPGGSGSSGGGGRNGANTPVNAAAAAFGASPSGTSQAGRKRRLGKGQSNPAGGAPSAAASALVGGPSAGRLIGNAQPPKPASRAARAARAVRNAPKSAVAAAKRAPQSAAGLAKRAPGAIGRGAVAGAKAAPGAAWKGAKLAGKGAKAAAPVAGAAASGAAASARRVGDGLSSGVGGDHKW